LGVFRPVAFGRTLVALGAACWAASQALENVQWSGDEPVLGYRLYVSVEEILEMVGSLSFFVATYAAVLATSYASTRRARGDVARARAALG